MKKIAMLALVLTAVVMALDINEIDALITEVTEQGFVVFSVTSVDGVLVKTFCKRLFIHFLPDSVASKYTNASFIYGLILSL